jgi:putative ABC transport system permease protein
MGRDFRSAMRSLRRTPWFFTAGVASLGLALGVSTLAFALIDAVAHPSLPYRDSQRLCVIFDRGWGPRGDVTTYDKYAQLRDGTTFYSDIGYTAGSIAVVTGPTGPEDGWTETTSANFFALLDVHPALGRVSGGGPGLDGGAIVSHSLWQRQYAGRRSLDGAVVTVDDHTYPVIAVLPATMDASWEAVVWLPLAPGGVLHDPGRYVVHPIARLKPGVSLDQVRAELAVVAARLTAAHGAGRLPFSFSVESLGSPPAALRGTHAALTAAGLTVLLIACANLGNLTLARGLARRRELAVRLALGATRLELVRHLTAEVIVISVAGAVVGCGAAVAGVRLLEYRMPAAVATIGVLVPRLDWSVFGAVLAATALTISLVGLVPAWRIAQSAVGDSLKDHAGPTTGRSQCRSTIVVGEIAVSMALLLAAGLLVKAAERVSRYEFGFDGERLLSVWTRPSASDTTTEAAATALAGLEERIRRVDGVQAVATIASVSPVRHVVRAASVGDGSRRLVLREYAVVDPDFLRALGIPILTGRDFESGDAVSPGVAIVDATAARALWPHGTAGAQISLGDDGSHSPWLPVVGVARAASFQFSEDPDAPPEPMIYVVTRYQTRSYRWIAVRANTNVTSTDGARIALAVHRAIATAGGGRGVVRPWRAQFTDVVAGRHFIAGLFIALGGLALLLSSTGLFAVLAYTVSQRMREFGIRMALGADRATVCRLVLHDAAVMVLAGTGLGAFFAMWSAKLLAAWLYGVDPTDAGALVSAECVLIAASFAACLVPALRAAAADPQAVLRAE